MALRRLQKELRGIRRERASDDQVPFSAGPEGEDTQLTDASGRLPAHPDTACLDMFRWQVTLLGPEGSPWEGGIYFLSMVFSPDYPFKPPVVRFETEIFHPWVSPDGRPCLGILDEDSWKPAFSVRKVILAVRGLLCTPGLAAADCRARFFDWDGPCSDCLEKSRKLQGTHESNLCDLHAAAAGAGLAVPLPAGEGHHLPGPRLHGIVSGHAAH